MCFYVFFPWASHGIAFSGVDNVNAINDVLTLNFTKINQAFIATKTNHDHASTFQTITNSVPVDVPKNIHEVASCHQLILWPQPLHICNRFSFSDNAYTLRQTTSKIPLTHACISSLITTSNFDRTLTFRTVSDISIILWVWQSIGFQETSGCDLSTCWASKRDLTVTSHEYFLNY